MVDMDSIQFEVSNEVHHDRGLAIDVFDLSTPTQGLVRQIEQQQRGEIEDYTFDIHLSSSVRIQSEDTPTGAHILDISEERLRGIVTRLRGRGLTPANSSTPSDQAGPPPPPPNPDVSSVLEPTQLPLRFSICFISLPTYTPLLSSGISSRTRSRSRLATSSTDMSLPDPRPVVAPRPRRRRQPARQPAPAPPQPEQLPNCDANLMLERYTPNHMRFMNVPEDPEPEAQQPDPAPLEPGQVPNDVNPLLARYRANHMRFLDE